MNNSKRARSKGFRSGSRTFWGSGSYGPWGILSWTRHQVEEVSKAATTAAQQIVVGVGAGAGIIGGSDNPLRTGFWYTAALLASGLALGSLNYFSKKREANNKAQYEADKKAEAQPEVDELKRLTEVNQSLRFENGYLRRELTKAGSSQTALELSNASLTSVNDRLTQQNERLINLIEQAVVAGSAASSQPKPVQNPPQIGSARALEDRRGRGRSAGRSHSGRRI